jgi:hypothetical protein
LDSSRLRTGELVAGIGGIALFVFLFFDWFGGGGFSGNQSGWDGLGADSTGFIVALTSIAGMALGLLAMTGQRVNVPLPRGGVTAVLGSLSVAIILWRFFANPGDLKIGIFLGLAAAVAIAIGAILALREDGVEPLVSVPGGRTRAASASAPTAEAPAAATTPASGRSSTGGGSGTKRSTNKRSGGASASGSGARKTPSSAKGRSSSRSSGSRSGGSKSRGSRSGGTKRSSTRKKK